MANLRHILIAVIIATITVMVGIVPASAETLKLAYVAPVGTINHEVGEQFKAQVENLSGGQIKVNLFPGGQLGNLPQLFGQLKKGAIDLFKTDVVVASLVGGGKSLHVLAAPYLFRDQNHFETFCSSSLFKGLVKEIEEKNGVQWIGLLADRSPRAVTTRNKMVLTPDDIKDQKIRGPKATCLSKVVRGWGASVVILPASEIYTGLKQKVADGQENGLEVVHGMKLYEVQKYYTATDHMLSAESLWMNQQKWNALNADQKELIVKAAKMARDWGNRRLHEKTLEWFDVCRANGMTIIMPPLKAWIEASQKVIADLDGNEWPEGLYSKIQSVK
jgi:tripartite ATP-independent transporter DctP family solute receptor